MTTFADYVAWLAPPRHGLHVIELGEDGGTLVIPGHHDDRRTLAALNHYARDMWGHGAAGDFADPGDGEHVRRALQRVRGLVVHACDRGWAAEDPIAAADLDLVDPDHNPCPDCARTGATWALIYRTDVQDHPAAFPITAWEYDA